MSGATPAVRNAVYRYSLRRQKIAELRDSAVILTPDDAARFGRTVGLAEEEQEHLIAVMLDVRNRVLGYCLVTIGLKDRTQIHARETFRQGLMIGAVRLVLIHNHPSGDPAPSAGDVQSTRELVQAGKIVGIEVVDHVIVGDPELAAKGYASLRELGYV